MIPADNAIDPYVYKLESFDYEKELRAVICKWEDYGKEVFDKGIFVPVDLDILIEKVYISPPIDQRFKDSIKAIVKKYNLKNVLNSQY